MNKNIHILPHKDGWAVLRESSIKPLSVHASNKEADKVARTLAQKGQCRTGNP